MATRDTAIAKPPSRLREPIVSSAAPGGALQDIAAPGLPSNSWKFSFFAFCHVAILL
jgi:hypothetical protein